MCVFEGACKYCTILRKSTIPTRTACSLHRLHSVKAGLFAVVLLALSSLGCYTRVVSVYTPDSATTDPSLDAPVHSNAELAAAEATSPTGHLMAAYATPSPSPTPIPSANRESSTTKRLDQTSSKRRGTRRSTPGSAKKPSLTPGTEIRDVKYNP
jgi:hypothetical protein